MKKYILLFIMFIITVLSFAVTKNSVDADTVKMEWYHDGEHMHYILSGKTTGWVSAGFETTGVMKDANIIIGYVDKNGKVFISDEFGISMFTHEPVEKLGGKSEVVLIGGSEKNGITTLEFKLPLKSKDKYHKDITGGKNIDIILAAGNTDDFSSMHSFATVSSIQYNFAGTEKVSSNNAAVSKGGEEFFRKKIINFMGWVCFALVSLNTLLYISRMYYKIVKDKSNKNFWEGYRKIMSLLKNIHVYSGLAVIAIGITHGIMELGGTLYLHTGLIVWIFIVVLFILFASGKSIKAFNKKWLVFHRIFAVLLWFALIIHVLKIPILG